MLIINGVNVYPSQIEEVLMKMPEVGKSYSCNESRKPYWTDPTRAVVRRFRDEEVGGTRRTARRR